MTININSYRWELDLERGIIRTWINSKNNTIVNTYEIIEGYENNGNTVKYDVIHYLQNIIFYNPFSFSTEKIKNETTIILSWNDRIIYDVFED